MTNARWKRKSDGVLVLTRLPDETRDVLVTREDNGHVYWATWEGLHRKYLRIES